MKLADTISIPMTDSARDSLTAISVLVVLFAVVVSLRVRARMRGPGMGLDDIFAIVAVLLTISTIGINAAVFTSGVGHDFYPDSSVYPSLVHNLPYIMKNVFAFTLIYIWALAALKLSQLALYHRVFSHQLRIHVYILVAIVIAWAIIFNFCFLFLCNPISQQWTVVRVGKCMDQILLLKCLIMTNLVTDLAIVIMPVQCILQLNMRKTEKFAVLACFGMGLACVIIGIARFILIYTIDLVGNLTGTSLTTFVLCTIELSLAGICTSVPMLRPLYLVLRSKYKKTSGSGSEAKRSKTFQDGPSQPRPGQWTQWMELADKDQTTITATHDDASSERKLTSEQPFDTIQVSKDFVVTRD